MFFAYLYKKRGVRVYYFGQSAPIKQIKKAAKVIKPNWVLTYSVISPKGGLQSLVEELGECESDENYLLVNSFQKDASILYPPNVKEITSHSEVI